MSFGVNLLCNHGIQFFGHGKCHELKPVASEVAGDHLILQHLHINATFGLKFDVESIWETLNFADVGKLRIQKWPTLFLLRDVKLSTLFLRVGELPTKPVRTKVLPLQVCLVCLNLS